MSNSEVPHIFIIQKEQEGCFFLSVFDILYESLRLEYKRMNILKWFILEPIKSMQKSYTLN